MAIFLPSLIPRSLARRPAARKTDDHSTGCWKWQGHAHQFSFLSLLARPHMLLLYINSFRHDPAFIRKNRAHRSSFPPVVAGNYLHRVAFFYFHAIHTTSDDNEIIFAYPRSRISRAMGPKMRPPLGSMPSITTAALSSKRTYDPSDRRCGAC